MCILYISYAGNVCYIQYTYLQLYDVSGRDELYIKRTCVVRAKAGGQMSFLMGLLKVCRYWRNTRV